MSTAKSTANESEASTAKVPQSDEGLTAEDFASILATTLALAQEAHIRISYRNAPPTPLRPAGLMIFIPAMEVDDRGALQVTRTAVLTEE